MSKLYLTEIGGLIVQGGDSEDARVPQQNSQVQKLSHISFYNNTVENRQKIIRQTEN